MAEEWELENVDHLWAALEKKGTRADCPSCGGTSWGRGEGSVLLQDWEEAGQAIGGLVALALICDNCGFIRLHDASTLGT